MTTPKDFGFNDDINMLKDTYAKFLLEQKTIEALRPSLSGTEDPYHGAPRQAFFDAQNWQKTVELGMHAVAIPEAQGALVWAWLPRLQSQKKSAEAPYQRH